MPSFSHPVFFTERKKRPDFLTKKTLRVGWLGWSLMPIQLSQTTLWFLQIFPVFGALPIVAGDKLAEKPSGKLTGHNRKSIIWRCISYWKRWISIAPPVRGSIYHSPRNESLIRPCCTRKMGVHIIRPLPGKLLKGGDFDVYFWPQSVKSRWSTCRTSWFSSGHVSSLNTAGKLNM